MTEQIYNSDAYQKEIQSEIIDIGEDYLILDKTIFSLVVEDNQMI